MEGYSVAARGYTYAFLNVLFDVVGAILIKVHAQSVNCIQINLIRFGVAAVTIGLASFAAQFYYRKGTSDDTIRDRDRDGENNSNTSDRNAKNWYELPAMSRKSWILVSSAVFFVTFLAPVCATYSLFRMPIGTLVGLTSTGPLFSLPAVYFIKKETVTWKGIVGALTTVSGVVLLCNSL